MARTVRLLTPIFVLVVLGVGGSDSFLATLLDEIVSPAPALAQVNDGYITSNDASGSRYLGSQTDMPAWARTATNDARYRAGIPGSPHEPTLAVRPSSWPGAAPPDDEPRIPTRDDVRRAAAIAAERQQAAYRQASVQQVAYLQPGSNVAPGAAVSPVAGPMPAQVPPAVPVPPPYQATSGTIPTAPQVPLTPPSSMPAGPPLAPIGDVPYASQTPIDAGLGMTRVPGPATGPIVADQGAPPGAQVLSGATILARVGSDVILASEVALHVNEVLKSNADKIPPEYLEPIRERLTRQRLEALIDTKAVIIELRRKIPAENLKKIDGSLADEFEKHELKRRLERAKVQTRTQLDEIYRTYGTSLEREKRAFMEMMLAQQWVQNQIKRDFEISHDEMLAYYHDHIADYEFAAKARWEQISVRHFRGRRKREAYAKIAELGNRVMRGEPFAEVAKSGSDGPTAADGGVRDWTTAGSLASKKLDHAIFSLPIGTLSAILEDDDAFHIVRVIERQEAGRTPFTETQAEIKEKIRAERIQGQAEDYVDEARASVQVSTIFDHLPPLDEKATARAKPDGKKKR
ncbi:MAG: peptidylprolyl isomerase [Pirellulales bacterium]|nr:peptidylprolyl isomerase [Pirellulales bacterium]